MWGFWTVLYIRKEWPQKRTWKQDTPLFGMLKLPISLHLPVSSTSLKTQLRCLTPMSRTFLEPLTLQEPVHVALHAHVSWCTISSCSPCWNSCFLLHDCLHTPSSQAFWALGFALFSSVLSYFRYLVNFTACQLKNSLEIIILVPSWN